MFPLVALFAPLLVGDDARAISLSERLRPPSTSHLLGTDELGRDVLSRLVLGARVSVTVGIVSSALALLIGSLAGAAAGLAPRFDPAVLFAINVVSALPSLVLAAAGAALLGSTAVGVILLIALTSWPDTARLVRSEARRVVQAPFVDAARAAGASGPRVLLVHVLPHALLPAIAGAPYV
ncbi:MAG: ABC transporter permease, partial [Acidobacteria bacterium]|nr:ABC transporter permease [Acidobacteriota bacterium]